MTSLTIQERIQLQDAYLTELKDIAANVQESLTAGHSARYYDTRIELLNNLYKNYKENHFHICQSTDLNSTTNYFDSHKYGEFEDLYVDTLVKLREKATPAPTLNNTIVPQPLPSTSPSSEVLHTLVAPAHRRKMVKLPFIPIPEFSGSYKSWRSFRDLFVSLIHSDPDIPNVQKLHYLKSHVSGEAERLLRQFDITDFNYKKAWEFLKNDTITQKY